MPYLKRSELYLTKYLWRDALHGGKQYAIWSSLQCKKHIFRIKLVLSNIYRKCYGQRRLGWYLVLFLCCKCQLFSMAVDSATESSENEIETNVVAKKPEPVIDFKQQSETTSPEI